MQHGDSVIERLAKLEVRTQILENQQKEIIDKLDELLGLRHKGVGAFWVISALTGTGIIGVLVSVIEWIRGGH